MRTRLSMIAGLGMLLAPIALWAQEKKEAEKVETKRAKGEITVLLPESSYRPVVLKIEGQETKQTGEKRTFTTPELETGKTYIYKLEAVIEPNNYTKIMRTREVTFKAGEKLTVDMRQEDKKLDKIVVRWVPTPDDVVDKMAELAKVGKDDVVYDPGCGDAVMLIRPIKQFGAKKGIGIDIDEKMV